MKRDDNDLLRQADAWIRASEENQRYEGLAAIVLLAAVLLAFVVLHLVG